MSRLPPTSSSFPYTTLFRSPFVFDMRCPCLSKIVPVMNTSSNAFSPVNFRPVIIMRDTQRKIMSRMKMTGLKFTGEKRSEEHTAELQSRRDHVCRLLLEEKK